MSGTARVAVVTGANRGIGLEVVRRLAARGCTVVLGCRDVARGRRSLEGLGPLPGTVRVTRLDVTDDDTVVAAAEQVRAEHGGVDVVVNNAAIHYDTGQRTVTADLRVVREALDTNVLGAWQVAIAFAPLLRPSGRLVNVSSGAGSFAETEGDGTAPAYAVSKAALNMLTVKLAADLRPRGILVNAVCPRWVATDMGGPGGRPVGEGAASVLAAVDLPDDGPTGAFFRDGRRIPW